jgi:hypothetical protein
MLDETFCRKAAWASVHRFAKATLSSGRGTLWFFPVDNSLGNKDPVMLEIKKSVQKVVQEEKYVNKMVPFTWLKVLERLQEAGRDSYISLEEVVKLSQECGMQHADAASLEEEVLQMLKTFNDLGQLMHHTEPSLRNKVILDAAHKQGARESGEPPPSARILDGAPAARRPPRRMRCVWPHAAYCPVHLYETLLNTMHSRIRRRQGRLLPRRRGRQGRRVRAGGSDETTGMPRRRVRAVRACGVCGACCEQHPV